MPGPQALSIYCDTVVRDSIDRNARLRKENTLLDHGAYAMLHTIQLFHGDGQFTSIPMQEFVPHGGGETEEDEEAVEYWVYNTCTRSDTPIELRWNYMGDLVVGISGVVQRPNTLNRGPLFPEFTVLEDENAIHVVLYYCNEDVVLTGKIQNLADSTIDELYHMIHSKEIRHHYIASQVLRNAAYPFTHPVLDNATFTVEKIFIRFLQELNQELISIDEDIEPTEEASELVALAKANPVHESLGRVAGESQLLDHRHALLQASRVVVQSLDVSYPGIDGMQSIRMLLENGERRVTATNKPGWFLNVPVDGPRLNNVPLCAVNQMQIRLAGLLWDKDDTILQTGYRATLERQGQEQMTVGVGSILLCFEVDESWAAVDIGNRQNIFHWYFRGYPCQPICTSLTVRLSGIHIRLGEIQHILKVLGVDAGNGDE